MKIDNQLNTLLKSDQKNAADLRNKSQGNAKGYAPAKAENTTTNNDVVKLSSHSRLLARAQELAQNAPDIREDKVNDIKSRLAANTYNVSGQTVAEAMIRKSITEV